MEFRWEKDIAESFFMNDFGDIATFGDIENEKMFSFKIETASKMLS